MSTDIEVHNAKKSDLDQQSFDDAVRLVGRRLLHPRRRHRRRSGRQIDPRTLHDAGLALLFACNEGICGSCKTRALSGTPHDNDSLTPKNKRAATS
ncbi:hypothetical protein RKD54_004543 [Pseudarthrobacter sp. SLBN-100]|uniref:2Fe-2S iron-sulfur cluster-binding protein n=1 Tax=Arthrobacter sp. SLBN-100 TaxID=2768450 RepID=UPI00114E3FDB|nr:2Fe-2S iron-sulfur cluster binding domain-containing protein [Arthrobacter sp. SLBN-100]